MYYTQLTWVTSITYWVAWVSVHQTVSSRLILKSILSPKSAPRIWFDGTVVIHICEAGHAILHFFCRASAHFFASALYQSICSPPRFSQSGIFVILLTLRSRIWFDGSGRVIALIRQAWHAVVIVEIRESWHAVIDFDGYLCLRCFLFLNAAFWVSKFYRKWS